MKNKLKKIIPLILCFVMIFSNCIIADAKNISLPKLNNGEVIDFAMSFYDELGDVSGYRIYHYGMQLVEGEDVYCVALYNETDMTFEYYPLLFSKNSFKVNIKTSSTQVDTEDEITYDWTPDFSSSTSKKATSIVYNDVRYYYCHYISSIPGASGRNFNVRYSSVPTYSSSVMDNYGPFFEMMFQNNLMFDDGSALEYAQQPTASIEPPRNLSIYRGYSNADKQYKFQMQWDKPEDTNLNVEVMYNIHWKEGTGSALGFGTHVYKKYPHITYESGHSAQTNKLQYLEDDLLKGYFASQDMEVPAFYNIDEIYVRFAKEVDGVIQYSLWRKIDYLNLDEGNGFDATEDDFKAESSTGAFDTSDNWIDQSVQNGEIVNGSDKENAKAPGLDANGDNITNVDTPIVNPNVWDEGTIFSTFTDALQSAVNFAAGFPAMVSEFFGFLPPSIIGCISIGLLMVIILRFLGR